MVAVGKKGLTAGHRFQDAGLVFLAQQARVDSLQTRNVTDEALATVCVQVVRHKHPASLRISGDRLLDMATEILLRPCQPTVGAIICPSTTCQFPVKHKVPRRVYSNSIRAG